MKPIQQLLAEIRPYLPAGWTVSEACNLGGGAEFALVSAAFPEEFRYGRLGNLSPEARKALRERRMAWRDFVTAEGAELAATLTHNLVGVRIQRDVTQIYVRR